MLMECGGSGGGDLACHVQSVTTNENTDITINTTKRAKGVLWWRWYKAGETSNLYFYGADGTGVRINLTDNTYAPSTDLTITDTSFTRSSGTGGEARNVIMWWE